MKISSLSIILSKLITKSLIDWIHIINTDNGGAKYLDKLFNVFLNY